MIAGRRRPTASSPLTRPSRAPNSDAGQRREPGIEAGDHQQRREHGGEIEHPADREVDLADRQQEHHADRQHAEEGGVAEDGEEVDRVEEARPGHADDDHHDDERDDDADLLGQPEAVSRADGRRAARRRADGLRSVMLASCMLAAAVHRVLRPVARRHLAGVDQVQQRAARRSRRPTSSPASRPW